MRKCKIEEKSKQIWILRIH